MKKVILIVKKLPENFFADAEANKDVTLTGQALEIYFDYDPDLVDFEFVDEESENEN